MRLSLPPRLLSLRLRTRSRSQPLRPPSAPQTVSAVSRSLALLQRPLRDPALLRQQAGARLQPALHLHPLPPLALLPALLLRCRV
jgi:hypothetical protein